jgi:hypothetical protein
MTRLGNGQWTVVDGERGVGRLSGQTQSKLVKPNQTKQTKSNRGGGGGWEWPVASGQWTVVGGERGWENSPGKPSQTGSNQSNRVKPVKPGQTSQTGSNKSNPVKPVKPSQTSQTQSNQSTPHSKSGARRRSPLPKPSNPVMPGQSEGA